MFDRAVRAAAVDQDYLIDCREGRQRADNILLLVVGEDERSGVKHVFASLPASPESSPDALRLSPKYSSLERAVLPSRPSPMPLRGPQVIQPKPAQTRGLGRNDLRRSCFASLRKITCGRYYARQSSGHRFQNSHAEAFGIRRQHENTGCRKCAIFKRTFEHTGKRDRVISDSRAVEITPCGCAEARIIGASDHEVSVGKATSNQRIRGSKQIQPFLRVDPMREQDQMSYRGLRGKRERKISPPESASASISRRSTPLGRITTCVPRFRFLMFSASPAFSA